ncbi:hypothetical protein ACAX43_30600 [Paraburkholderia sp. IW21]
MLAHELRSANVDGVSGVRDLAVGRWSELTGHSVDTACSAPSSDAMCR